MGSACPVTDKVKVSCLICKGETIELSDIKNIKILNVNGIVDHVVSNLDGCRYIVYVCSGCVGSNSGSLIRG